MKDTQDDFASLCTNDALAHNWKTKDMPLEIYFRCTAKDKKSIYT